jgi:protoporphyrinogen oxidase
MAECGDIVVLGGGPAGLAAALAAARDGATVTLIESAGHVGGLCRTLSGDGCRFDLGGHIPFIHDVARVAWAEQLMDSPMRWIDRPVARVQHGRIVPGRYIDQMPQAPDDRVPDDGTAAGELGSRIGAGFRDHVVRPYVEKVDGWPLEVISADRSRKLRDEQQAPEGFWYPEGGIGALMDAMADGITRHGGDVRLGTPVTALSHENGRVTGITVGGDHPGTLTAPSIICAINPVALVDAASPPAPHGLLVPITMRAVTLVYLVADREQLTDEAWIQVADRRVPFSRIAEFRHWDPGLVPDGRTVLCAEVYGDATEDDPWWPLDDEALAQAVRDSLVDPLGWADDASGFRTLTVIRMPRAYPLVEAHRVDEVTRAPRWLMSLEGIELARGGTVMTAIAAGEAAVAGVTAGAR